MERFGPLLEHSDENPCATIIGLYVQAIEDEIIKHDDLGPSDEQREAITDLLDLDEDAVDEPYSEDMIRCQDALPLVINLDEAFRRYVIDTSLSRCL